MNLQTKIKTALGEIKPSLVLKNGNVVNVFTGDVSVCDVAIADGIIVGLGEYEGVEEIDATGKYIMPGFINAHCHVESSMVTPMNYSLAELMWGTTTIITDPHEMVNVAGHRGVEYILNEAKKSPLNYYVALPSCVPATPFENSGAKMFAKDLITYKENPSVIGLGEMMNYVGVNACDPDVLDKIEAFSDRVIDGHAPGLTKEALSAYKIAGIDTEHECVTYEEALEKARCGMAVLVREGSASKNEEAILKGFIDNGNSTFNLAFATDDKHLYSIYEEGTIRHNVAKAVSLGMNPVQAVQIATINAARIYGLKNKGAIAPGYQADIVMTDDLKEFNVLMVLKDGNIAVKDGKLFGKYSNLKEPEPVQYHCAITDSVNCAPVDKESLKIEKRDIYPVIKMVPGQIVTQKEMIADKEIKELIEKGEVLKIAVIERHNATGNIGVGYIKGYGIRNASVATTVAHDSHNLIVVGDNDEDMLSAIEEIKRVHGGYAIASGKDVSSLPLKICGLMSDEQPDVFIKKLGEMIELAKSLGVSEGIDPFTTLSFMALPVIPEIRITDMGMFDVTNQTMV